jgi:hypothetical protein
MQQKEGQILGTPDDREDELIVEGPMHLSRLGQFLFELLTTPVALLVRPIFILVVFKCM